MSKYKLIGLGVLLLLLSCNEDDGKAITTVLEEVERGAVLRTLTINDAEFEVNNPQSIFDIVVEEQDIEEGNLLERVDMYLSFIDNTPGVGESSTNALLFKSFVKDDFNTDNLLPRLSLLYTFQEFADFAGVDVSQVYCKDQFRIDLELILSDGKRFSTSNSGGTIVNTSGFFKSPFSYLVNVVEPIPQELFVGDYFLKHEKEGFFGPTFAVDRNVTLRKGHSNNTRVFDVPIHMGTLEIEFTVACDASVITRYQKIDQQCTQDFSDRVLIGPDSTQGYLSDTDDAVLQLKFLEAFEDYDAFCGYSNFPASIELSKQ